MNSRSLSLSYFGHRVQIWAETAELAALAKAALPPDHSTVLPTQGDILLEVRLRWGPPPDLHRFPAIDPNAFLRWEAGFRIDRDGFVSTMGQSAWAAYCQLPMRTLNIWVTETNTLPPLLPNFALMPALSIALGDVGLHLLHAATVAHDDRALILAGPSGCGKTTTALLLHAAGWTLLSDEAIAFEAGDGLIYPIWQQPRLRPASSTLFPHLAELRHKPPTAPQGLRPLAVMLPEVSPSGQVELSGLPANEALVNLLGLGIWGPLPRQRQAALQAMLRLVRSCPTYRLRLAPDAQRIVSLVEDLIQS